MSALLLAADEHRTLPGFILFIGHCQRPTCGKPIVRVVLDRYVATVLGTKWCSKNCRRKAARKLTASPFVMLNGICKACGKWFTRRIRQADTDAIVSHCSTLCRARDAYMPCEVCAGANLRPPASPICARCFHGLAASCAGKYRHPTMTSARRQLHHFRRQDPRRFEEAQPGIYTCWACSALHIGAEAHMTPERAARIAAAAALLRQRLDPDRWDELVTEWAAQPRNTASILGAVVPADSRHPTAQAARSAARAPAP